MVVVPLPLVEVRTRSYWPLTVRSDWVGGLVWPPRLFGGLMVVLPQPVEKLIASAIRTARLQCLRFKATSLAETWQFFPVGFSAPVPGIRAWRLSIFLAVCSDCVRSPAGLPPAAM